MDKVMTVFYSKNTGEIKLAMTGDVDFNVFLSNELDMKSFCNKAVVPINMTILQSMHEYIVDLENNEIVRKQAENLRISLQ